MDLFTHMLVGYLIGWLSAFTVTGYSEYLLLIKTRHSLFAAVSEAIRELHSYELPEILEFAVSTAEPNFHRWVAEMASGVPVPEGEGEPEPAFD